MSRHTPIIAQLINELRQLPGIGNKTAQRLAFHILSMETPAAERLANSILEAKHSIVLCSECCNLTDEDPCDICSSSKRDPSIVCVVEDPQDVTAIEGIHEYKGLYHVLHGAISPVQDIGPDKIKLRELLTRLQDHPEIKELILATNPTVEGEATALYIGRLLKPSGIKITRIAHGLPMGTDIEYADEVTLAKALSGRREI
mgnify:CR=1 FL=1